MSGARGRARCATVDLGDPQQKSSRLAPTFRQVGGDPQSQASLW